MNFQPPGKNQEWAEQEGFQFELWTDNSHEIALYYGAVEDVSETNPSRITVILNEEGRLWLEYREDIDTGTHPAQVLSDLQQLLGAR